MVPINILTKLSQNSLLQRDKACCIHGDGLSVRNFIYVEDIVKALDTMMHKGEPGEVYNIGTKIGITIIDLARYLIKKMKGIKDPEEVDKYITLGANRVYNDQIYLIDANKISKLGWKATIEWEDGISETIDWYKKNFTNWEGAESALSPFPKSLC